MLNYVRTVAPPDYVYQQQQARVIIIWPRGLITPDSASNTNKLYANGARIIYLYIKVPTVLKIIIMHGRVGGIILILRYNMFRWRAVIFRVFEDTDSPIPPTHNRSVSNNSAFK